MTNRLTKLDKQGNYYTVARELGLCGKVINPITNWIEDCEERNYGKPIDKLGLIEDLMEKYGIPNIEYLESCIKDHDKYGELAEKIGCPLDVVVKAFQKYIGWTTDCDFGYDNIPDEFEKYQNDKKFMNLKYNEGLMYIAIQETLEDIELEKTLKNKGK